MLTANQTLDQRRETVMDDKELYERGLKLRVEMFGREAVEKRMNAFGEFGKPLQHIINAYAYGRVAKICASTGGQIAHHGRDDGGSRSSE